MMVYYQRKHFGGLKTMKKINGIAVVIMVLLFLNTINYTVNSSERVNFIEDVQVACDIPLVH